jgi:hypothetical protein
MTKNNGEEKQWLSPSTGSGIFFGVSQTTQKTSASFGNNRHCWNTSLANSLWLSSSIQKDSLAPPQSTATERRACVVAAMTSHLATCSTNLKRSEETSRGWQVMQML